MKKGKYAKKTPLAKSLAVILAVVMLIGGVVGGTVAWLTDNTEAIVNTFTVGNIDIDLTEKDTDPNTAGNQYNYKMIPGHTMAKDPKVTVKGGSEDAWVFIKVQESSNLNSFIAYAIDPQWRQLTNKEGNAIEGVYYIDARNNKADKNIKILGEGTCNDDACQGCVSWEPEHVGVKTTVTKDMMDELEAEGGTLPTLTFTAYAVQYWSNNDTAFDPYDAWLNVPTT